MERSRYSVSLRSFSAGSGHVLTQADDNIPITDRTFGSEITLAATDDPANWKEITAEEAEELKQRQLEAYKPLT